jgi:vacuolar-type H+-ATPase subunit E/Vma4
MALADLIARLDADARARADEIRRRADDEAQALEADTARASADEAARALAERRAERRVIADRELLRERQRLRAEALEARRALVDRVIACARALAADAVATPGFLAGLPRQLDEARAYLDGVACRVRCAAPVAAVLAPHVAALPSWVLDVDDTAGAGFVVEALDGSVVVPHTIESRLDQMAAEAAIDILAEVERGVR